MEIFDAHVHICTDNFDEAYAELTALGIRKVISAPMVGTLAGSVEELLQGNRDALECYDAHPDFYYPGVIVHPAYQKESMAALQEFTERGLKWAGEWCSYKSGIDFDRPEWEPYFRYCCDNGMIVQMHNHEATAVIAARYPQLTIVGSHLNPQVLPLLTEYKNVFIDISGMHGGLVRKTLIEAEKLFGTDRLLFGTDYPGYDAQPFIVRCQKYYSEKQCEDVFSGNLRKIMKKHEVDF